MHVLAGDIGGTKTRLAIFNTKNGALELEIEDKFPSKNYQNLESIAEEFLVKHKHQKIEKACFGIAGPVKHGVCKATNLPWVVSEEEIKKRLKLQEVKLLNDLESNAYGLKTLKKEELFTLNQGEEDLKEHQALISAGTGLGEAGLFFDGKNHKPFACEGGHCDFAPRNEEEIELFFYLKKKYNHVSYERILSGPGLLNLYHFLIEEKKLQPKFPQDMQGDDLSKVISEKALNGSCSLCKKTLKLFCSLYGAEAGNTALKFYALGGVFLGGGIAPKIVDLLKDGVFLEAFMDKGRFSSLLSKIPVYVVLNEKTALLGSAYFASNFMK